MNTEIKKMITTEQKKMITAEQNIIKEMICFGDSNTYGLVPGTTNRYDYHTRWTGILQEKLKNRNFHITEEGLCGRTADFEDRTRPGRKGTAVFPMILESHSPVDFITIMLGTNDCKTYYGADAEKIAKGIEKLILQAKSICPDAKILLISPILLGEGVGEKGYDPEFDTMSVWHARHLAHAYEKVANYHNCDFLAASDFAAPSPRDREHLDEDGHRALAEAIYQKITEMDEKQIINRKNYTQKTLHCSGK